MKPEYQLKVEGLINKEQVMSGLLASGYVVSVKKRFGDNYEISIYGKEKVSGEGSKESEWIKEMGKHTHEITNIPGIGGGSITTTKIPQTWVHNSNTHNEAYYPSPKTEEDKAF